MCGIAGIVNKRGKAGPDKLSRLATQMADTMVHRGPDDSGVWVAPDGYAALAHRRLSIIDVSSAGHQPMRDESGDGLIVFNGELYNFLELRRDFEGSGVVFRTRSDTEVLLACLRRWGVDALAKLDAMFAIGYYRADTRELLLARDIFGEKPLYYLDTPDFFAFASELHALSVLPWFEAEITGESVAAYLCFQYLPGDQTIFRGARKLAPGHWLRLSTRGSPTISPYFSFRTSDRQRSSRSLDDLADELESLLVTSIRRRLVSDVPLGAFLSGGVDSSTVAAIATRKLGTSLKTYSIGFEGHDDSEHYDAAAIARLLETEHRDRVLSTDAVSLGSRIGRVLDEPNADTSCLPTYLLCGFAREQVTVAISGDGGDELFGGYGRYFNTVDEWERKKNGDRSLDWWKAGDVYLSNRILVYPDDELRRLLGELPDGLRSLLAEARGAIEADRRPLINVLREFDARTYMPGAVLAKVDRMSMQHSLEVRAPLLSIDIARFAMQLSADDCYSAGRGKLVLKQVTRRFLPSSWIDKPKRGFGLPMDMWGAEQLLPSLESALTSSDCRLATWIPHANLQRYLAHLAQEFHPYRAWALFILESWLRSHSARVVNATSAIAAA